MVRPKKPTIKQLKDKVWKVFSLYIRLKDADLLGYNHCYTCNKKFYYKDLQAGHGLGGRGNSILFDEELVFPQCKTCNLFKGGNYDIYHTKLIKEHGLKWFEKKLKLKNKNKQFTAEELNKLYNHYNKLLQELPQNINLKYETKK